MTTETKTVKPTLKQRVYRQFGKPTGFWGGLAGWMPGPLAVDATRAARLRTLGYQVFTQQIPADITPQNRLLLGEPRGG